MSHRRGVSRALRARWGRVVFVCCFALILQLFSGCGRKGPPYLEKSQDARLGILVKNDIDIAARAL